MYHDSMAWDLGGDVVSPQEIFYNIKLSDWGNDSIKTVLKTEIWIWNVDWRDVKFRQTKTRGLSVSAQKNHS